MAAIGMVIAQIVVVAQTLVLGRLLGPHEVGVFTAGTVLMGVMFLFAQGTLYQALIQREHDIEDAANTVLIVTCVTGLLLAVAALVASPLIGALFHDSRVGLIAAASSGINLLHSLVNVPDALMQRTFQFKRRLIIAPCGRADVRLGLDRVRCIRVRRVGDGHRHVRVDHHMGAAELVDGEMAPVSGAFFVPHLARAGGVLVADAPRWDRRTFA